ncbi:MAG: PhnD/SsuA/transferrin family substrate-binding protein [Verrucomicrobiae bacterium]|nr:PhnD/SsuA/transferrin family substrate-binding protein [Verrucomicrobiae bacterium]
MILFGAGAGWSAETPAEIETALRREAGEEPAPAGGPLRLVVGVNDVYCKDTSCKCVEHVAIRQYGDFCRALKERHRIELEPVYFMEPYELERAFRDGKFDGMLCKPWLVFRHAGGRSEGMARVADLRDPDGGTGLWGIVIVPRDSPIRRLADLSGRRIACGQPDAYEKHQAAFELFRRENIQIPASGRVEKASCLECLDLLMGGDVDAAVISNYALTADCAVDVASPDAFRIIGNTDKIPLTSLMVDLKRVSPDDARRLQGALLDLSGDGLPPTMGGGGFVAPASWKVPRARP